MKWHTIDTAPTNEWVLLYILPPPRVQGIDGFWLPAYRATNGTWIDIFEHEVTEDMEGIPRFWTELTEPGVALV